MSRYEWSFWRCRTWGLGFYVCRETGFVHLGPFRLSYFKRLRFVGCCE